jgi:hypothetical protein
MCFDVKVNSCRSCNHNRISYPPLDDGLYTAPSVGLKVSIMGRVYLLVIDECQNFYVDAGAVCAHHPWVKPFHWSKIVDRFGWWYILSGKACGKCSPSNPNRSSRVLLSRLRNPRTRSCLALDQPLVCIILTTWCAAIWQTFCPCSQ